MLKPNHGCTGLHYMEVTLWYVMLQGCFNIDSANIIDWISSVAKWQNTGRANILLMQRLQKLPFFRPVSLQVLHLSETHVHPECRSIKLTTFRDSSEGVWIPNFGQVFQAQIQEDRRHKVSGLVLGYDQNVLLDTIFIKLQNGLLFSWQPFHCPTSVDHLGLDCKVKYTNANQGIMPASHNIWVQYIESHLDNTGHSRVLSVPVWCISWTPPNQILRSEEHSSTGKTIFTFSKRWKQTLQWILHAQAQEYMVVIQTMYK